MCIKNIFNNSLILNFNLVKIVIPIANKITIYNKLKEICLFSLFNEIDTIFLINIK